MSKKIYYKKMEHLTTEQKIIAAAREVFMKKGFSATRTREIAQKAGTNLALVNYYFKSKKNLFHIIVEETMTHFIGELLPILTDMKMSLEEKTEIIVTRYTDLMLKNPDLPFFVINEMRTHNQLLKKIIQNAREVSVPVFEQQLKAKGIELSPINYFLNVISLTLFPFVARTLIEYSILSQDEKFDDLIQERKKQIPIWIQKMSEN